MNHLKVFHYNASNNLVSSEFHQTFYWNQTCSTKYSYDRLERVDTTFISNCLAENGVKYTVDMYEEDKIITTKYGFNRNIIGMEVTTFNDRNQPSTIDFFSSENKIIEQTVFQYDSNGLLQKAQFFHQKKGGSMKHYHTVKIKYLL